MKIKRLRKGFSLVEVLFGIFLAGLCATVLAATMPVATNSRVQANYQNMALSLAQKQMEAVRSLGYANLTPQQMQTNLLIDSATPVDTNTFSFTNVDNAMFDNPSTVLPQGQGRITVEQVELDMRRVTVEVSYNYKGRTQRVRLATLIANL